MRFSLLAANLLSSATIISAVPTSVQAPTPFEYIAADSPASSTLSKRNVGGVRLCTGIDWTGYCDYVIWPLNECINLRDYAGRVLSFRPDEDTECYLMQGKCDANSEYADLFYDSVGLGRLDLLPWCAEMQSYLCMEPLPV
ncbi:hypothetical protein LTR36_003523 [Oleoguttula mirabilis]|uniref:Uncharacterized protein n=1 Tax=Oleoguttula mirabilis TaxID=1507867 RepID=A0AAV9JJK8_9PEZI|nr:hypothetical protein LTR36_003523 [Oleoguttula mirabilis]